MLQGEHSAILSTFIKQQFIINTFVLSIFEWLLKSVRFTVTTFFLIFRLTTTLLEWLSGREGNDSRNYFMINLHESMARSHTFVEIDREIISTVILLPSAEPFKKGCCQLQVKICA